MLKKFLFIPVRFITFLAGFIFIGTLPVLLSFNQSKMSIELHFSSFIKQYFTYLFGFIQFNEVPILLKYLHNNELHNYLYSLNLLSLSLMIVSVSAIIISTMIMILPRSWRNRFKRFVDFSTTVPELLIIFILQYITIYMYKTYGIKLLRLYGSFNHEPYVEPLIIITFLPALFLIQFLVKEFTNEEQKEYVMFARAKGVSLWTIYFKHIFRNVFPLYLIHLRTIVWYILTNIFVVIHVFNMLGIYGIQTYLENHQGMNLILELILFTIPIILANLLANMVSRSMEGKE